MDENFRADLHCHSTCSDGTYDPKQIIELALKLKLKGLSITDHDTIEAYPEALLAVHGNPLSLISGVELSATHQKQSVHILAYGFSLSSSVIKSFCDTHHQRRLKRLKLILERLSAHGMPLEAQDFDFTSHSIGRPHIAQAMIKKKYVSTLQSAFRLYLREGKPCYVPSQASSVEETLEVIHRANGLAIIAHPHLISFPKILNDLLDMDFDGIEGYYARFAQSDHERWIKIGDRKGWLITGGSDFHGRIKPNLALGCSGVNEETFSILLKHFKKNNCE